MNRRERRAKAKRAGGSPSGPAAAPAIHRWSEEIYAAALDRFRNGAFGPAQDLCRAVLAREPRHVRSLVLLGDIAQQEGRNRAAVKLLTQALACDETDAAAHDTLALAYQALGRHSDAVQHFTQAIVLGLAEAEALIKRSAAVAAPLQRLTQAWPRPLQIPELLGPDGAAPLAREALLIALLQTRPVCDIELERLLTALRRGLLLAGADQHCALDDDLGFFAALAEQCFINEYVFACETAEAAQWRALRDRLAQALASGTAVAPRDVIVAACYRPLHELPHAASLRDRSWPDTVARIVRQQVCEPLEEDADRDVIPALTAIDDPTSLQVRAQYEESPFPRWTIAPPATPTTFAGHLQETLGLVPGGWSAARRSVDVLIAGCGTGNHSIYTARRFPQARILALDLSRASLAYARRKSRALALNDIEYAQADILRLASLDRRFDVIEAVGVLHHLADPEAGWRTLLELLRPNGLMFVGLYSASARLAVNAARAFVAAHGFRATADDIRAGRQALIRSGHALPYRDFASISGCRDLLFNVMEHQFTLPRIAAFLAAEGLAFLGFELPADIRIAFAQHDPRAAAPRDLAAWDAFEAKHPQTFVNMYCFWLQKSAEAASERSAP